MILHFFKTAFFIPLSTQALRRREHPTAHSWKLVCLCFWWQQKADLPSYFWYISSNSDSCSEWNLSKLLLLFSEPFSAVVFANRDPYQPVLHAPLKVCGAAPWTATQPPIFSPCRWMKGAAALPSPAHITTEMVRTPLWVLALGEFCFYSPSVLSSG